jgi:thiamine biosynthesis lipoprotein
LFFFEARVNATVEEVAFEGKLSPSLEGDGYIYRFAAMASPCEVHLTCADENLALRAGQIAEAEAVRIERKFSRYRSDSVVAQMNASRDRPVPLDAETAGLIDYAAQCYELSDGLFDITSGVLRRLWRFDGSATIPSKQEVREIRRFIGWQKVTWAPPELTVPEGMEVDFGGFGKEYAVDSALAKIASVVSDPVLVNFGGDLRVSGPRPGGGRWRIAIESADTDGKRDGVLEISHGALTTSGDANRCIIKDGVRYSHILDPRTGWPVEEPPRSVTVAAGTCVEAGLLSTLAMLHGREAEAFLKREGVQAWVAR